MERAAIYKFKKKEKYLIYAVAKVKMGAGVASEPYIWLDINTSLDEIVKHILNALKESDKILPTPENWDVFTKNFLNKIGLNKNKELHNESIYVGISKEDGILTFTPTLNMGLKGGFSNKFKKGIEISEDKGIHEIGLILQEALNLSE